MSAPVGTLRPMGVRKNDITYSENTENLKLLTYLKHYYNELCLQYTA